MGRYYFGAKTEADYLKKLEIWWLKRHGYLDGWKSGGIEWTHGITGDKSSIGLETCWDVSEGYVRLHYTQTKDGERREFDYRVPLTTTACRYGGQRYWFLCPCSRNNVPCGRRVGVLYKGGDYFACRHCYQLTYDSRNENRRSNFFNLARTVLSYDRVDKMRQRGKRLYYAGRLTKTGKLADRILSRASSSYRRYLQNKG